MMVFIHALRGQLGRKRPDRFRVAIVNHPWVSDIAAGGQGSLGVWSYQIARRLARSCEVLVLAPRRRERKSVEYQDGVRYEGLALKYDRRLLWPVQHMNGFRDPRRPGFASGLYYPFYAFQGALALRRQRCDIAHIYNFSQFVPIVRALNPRVRIVLHMHCEWLTQLDRTMIAGRLEHTDAVVGCSRHVTDKIQTRFPEFAGRCQTVFNGVDARHFSSAPASKDPLALGEKSLLFVGRVSPEKGVHVLLEAFALVVKQFPRARLDVIGDIGECRKDFLVALSDDARVTRLASFYDGRRYWSHLEDRLKLPGLGGRVKFHGSMPHSQLVSHYRHADVLVNPSLSEAFGMSLIEAMATETPVVASRVGGMAEIVEDGTTGVLVEPDDAKALADAICRVLSDTGLARSMGRAGRDRVHERFTWTRIAEDLYHVYEKVYEGGR